MTTVAELIAYLQTLPQETTIEVAVGVDGTYASYTSSETLELPPRNEDGSFQECSDNLDYSYGNGNPWMFFGRT